MMNYSSLIMPKRDGSKPGPKKIVHGKRICVSLGRGQRAFLDKKAAIMAVPIARLVRDAVTVLMKRTQRGPR